MNGGGAVVRLTDLVDRLDTEGGTAVLVATPMGHRVVRLSAVGAAVLDALTESGGVSDTDDLALNLVARFGEPEGAMRADVVGAIVDALAAEHVVVAES